MTTDTTATQHIGPVYTQFFTFAEGEPFWLESGETLQPVTLAYETYGALNADRTNAILICHALSGSAHAAGQLDGEAGTRPRLVGRLTIGPGKAFDTERFFVICSNVLGCCYGSTGPSASIDPDHGQTVRPALSGGDDWRYGAGAGQADRAIWASTSYSAWPAARWAGCRRWNGRAAHPTRLRLRAAIPDRHHRASQPDADRVQRSRVARRSTPIPSLESLAPTTTKTQKPDAGVGRGAHGRPHHLPERRVDARLKFGRQACSGHGKVRLRVRDRIRGGELSQVQRAEVHHNASTPTAIST
jgi:hypothetical protein